MMTSVTGTRVKLAYDKMSQDIANIVREFKRLRVFSNTTKDLICLSTGDLAPDDVRGGLLSVEKKGTSLNHNFVKSRLIEQTTDFYSRMPHNKAQTLATMYNLKVHVQKNKVIELKAERDILCRLLIASDSGNSRVDVLFDRYLETSIKDGTHSDHAGVMRPIRRVIDSRDVKMPQKLEAVHQPFKDQSRAGFIFK